MPQERASRLSGAHALLFATALGALALVAIGCAHAPTGEPAAAVVVRAATAQVTAAVIATPAPTLPAVAVTPPTTGRWIEVDVTRYIVRLMEGAKVIREIAPVAVGAKIDTGEYESTQTGLFHVYNKTAGLTYDAPYHTYIDWWVGFDPDKANGFHSFLLDEHGTVVDSSTGRISNGCIRTGDPQAVFAFAEVGMPVSVHS